MKNTENELVLKSDQTGLRFGFLFFDTRFTRVVVRKQANETGIHIYTVTRTDHSTHPHPYNLCS